MEGTLKRFLLFTLVVIAITASASSAMAAASLEGGALAGKTVLSQKRANECMRAVGKEEWPIGKSPVRGTKYRVWVFKRWKQRENEACGLVTRLQDPKAAICHVFGSYCQQALGVANCETGGTFSVRAKNGQYLGLFQMGSYERATYGHGDTPLAQARAAYRYFVASGRDWSPWQCMPNGGLRW